MYLCWTQVRVSAYRDSRQLRHVQEVRAKQILGTYNKAHAFFPKVSVERQSILTGRGKVVLLMAYSANGSASHHDILSVLSIKPQYGHMQAQLSVVICQALV